MYAYMVKASIPYRVRFTWIISEEKTEYMPEERQFLIGYGSHEMENNVSLTPVIGVNSL